MNYQNDSPGSPRFELIRQNFIIASKYGKFKEFSNKKFNEISSARIAKAGQQKQLRLENKLKNMTTMAERNQQLKEEVNAGHQKLAAIEAGLRFQMARARCQTWIRTILLFRTFEKILKAHKEVVKKNAVDIRYRLFARFFFRVVIPYCKIKKIGLSNNAMKHTRG